MTADQENDRNGIDEEILGQLEDIDDQLADELAADSRIESGVPDNQRGDDLDFIQMSGLTSPEVADTPEDIVEEGAEETDTSQPLSFHEKGVADVDSTMAPGILESPSEADEEVAGGGDEAIPALRDMIKEHQASHKEEELDEAPLQEEQSLADTPQELEETAAALAEEEFPDEPTLEEINEEEEEPPQDEEPEVDVLYPMTHSEPLQPAQVESENAAAAAATVAASRTPREDPAPSRPSKPPRTPTPDISEAEEYLAELQSQSRLRPAHIDPVDAEEPVSELPRGEDWESSGGEDDGTGVRKRHRSHSRRRRKIVKWIGWVLLACLMCIGVYVGYTRFRIETESPETLYWEAGVAQRAGEFAESSGTYRDFALRFPDHPLAPDAQFMAAYMMQLSQQEDGKRSREAYQLAAKMFDQFIKDNPGHPKVARAQVMLGVLDYHLGDYQAAVARLQNPDLRVLDDVAVLAVGRILARCYAELGEYDQAESTYLQVATTPANTRPDMDYDELGNMFRKMAESTMAGPRRLEYREKAVEYWKRASQFPGIAPTSRNELTRKASILEEQMRGEGESLDEPYHEQDPVDSQILPEPLEDQEPPAPAMPDGQDALDSTPPDGQDSLDLTMPEAQDSLDSSMPEAQDSLDSSMPDAQDSLDSTMPDGQADQPEQSDPDLQDEGTSVSVSSEAASHIPGEAEDESQPSAETPSDTPEDTQS